MAKTSAPKPAVRVRGYLYISGATFFWAVSATLGRAAFTGHLLAGGRSLPSVDPVMLAQSRSSFAFLLFFLYLLPRRGWRNLVVRGSDLGRFLLLGVLGVAASNYFYYLAIQKTNVATAIIVQYTAPVWVLLYMVVGKREKPTLGNTGAVALALLGVAMVIGVSRSGALRLNPAGVAAALAAAFSYAFYNVAGHRLLARFDRGRVMLYATLAAALFWLLVDPPARIAAAHYAASQWLFLAVFSVISMVVPFSLYFAGLEHLDPARAIVVSCLEPVFSIVIAAVVLGEIVRPPQILGILLVLAAVTVIALAGGKPGVRPEALGPVD